MGLQQYSRLVRERWLLIVLSLLLATGAGVAFVLTATPQYEASTKLFVSTVDDRSSAQDAYQGGLFSQQRVKSYADIVTSPDLAQAVIDDLHLRTTPDALQKRISASAPMDTVLISVAVQDPNPTQAKLIAESIDRQFSTVVSQLETPEGSTTSSVKVSVVERPRLPEQPISPNKVLDVGIGILAGLVGGLGLALFRDAVDNSVGTREEAAEVAGAPSLGVIQDDPQAKNRPLIVADDRFSSRAEAFRQLRTNISFLGIDENIHSLVVSSALPAEGKTTTTANLAIALAQAGQRVLLVDADLRRPQLADLFGLERSIGLTDVLLGTVQVETAVQTWREDLPLYVLPSGPNPPNPSELLGSQRMADLVKRLESEVDVVLFDAPPLLPVTDAAVLGRHVNGALLVTRAGATKLEHLKQAAESLRSVDVRILGTVLNRKPRRGKGSSYDSYGGYRYQSDNVPKQRKGDGSRRANRRAARELASTGS
jgi:succinoglycan biosynthesis transport protein ExoP